MHPHNGILDWFIGALLFVKRRLWRCCLRHLGMNVFIIDGSSGRAWFAPFYIVELRFKREICEALES